MQSTFDGARSFNQPLDSWDVSSVTLMIGMFSKASSFNQPLNLWNVSSVIDTGMCLIFYKANSFDKNNALWYNFNY